MKIFLSVFLASVAMVASQGFNPTYLPQFHPNQYYQQQPLVMQITPSVQLPFSSLIQHSVMGPSYTTQSSSSSSGSVATPSISMPSFLSQPQVKQQNYRPSTYNKPSKKPIVTKSFFIHSAPEETEEEVQREIAQLDNQQRKHYNVLFVKTPAQTNKHTALNFIKALNEEKTVVYVLSKKTTAADLQESIRDAPQHTTKPEVFFIKYRTPEEAANAQRQIQTQYDSLGGSTTISDEGLAPVTSVIGSLEPQAAPEEESAQGQDYDDNEESVQPQGNNNNNYLPPQY